MREMEVIWWEMVENGEKCRNMMENVGKCAEMCRKTEKDGEKKTIL